MKKTLLAVVLFSLMSSFVLAQSDGDFRSFQTGDWNDVNTWERFDGNTLSWVNPAPSTPTSASGIITIIDTHVVTVTSNVTVDQVEWDNSCPFCGSSGSIVVASGITLSVANGAGDDVRIINDFSNVGLLQVFGTLSLANGATIVDDDYGNLGAGPGPVTADTYKIMNGGTHIHTTGTGVSAVPAADWQTGSTCRITATSAPAPSIAGGIIFHNFIWNGASQTAGMNLSGTLTNVAGDLTVLSTNNQLLQLSTTQSYTLAVENFFIQGNSRVQFSSTGNPVILDINGNLDISSSSVSVNAIQFNATGNVDVNVGGNFVKTGVSTVNLCAGTTGTTRLDVSGNFSLTGGTVTRGATVTSGGATISFMGSTPATYTNSTAAITTTINYFVDTDKSLTLGTSILSGAGTFTLSADATLGLGSTHASGALQNTTTVDSDCGNITLPVAGRTFQSGSIIHYNGSGAQFMGDGQPSGSGITTRINNASGVTMAANATIGGLLYLDNGNLSIGVRTLTLNDEFLADPGNTLVITTSSSIAIGLGDAGAFGTLVTSGASALNNLSFTRNGQTLFLGSNLGINGTFAHDGNINFAGRTLTISGPYTITSGSLIGDATSTLQIAGSGTITGDVPLQGTLGTLTINRPVGVTNTTSINIATALNILSGTYQGSGSVTLASGATLTRADGQITKSITATNYHLVYASTSPINTGTELITSPTTALNNLTITNNAVTLNSSLTTLTVNGTLTLTSGTFDTNSKPVVLEGNVVSNATGDFIGSIVTFSGNSTLSGSVSLDLDNVEIETGATLNLGTVTLRVAGDFTPDAGAIIQPGSASTFFNGTTVLTLPDVATQVQFHNVLISSNSSLTISCTDCGSENNRPAMVVNGIWDSNAVNAVFTPAPNIPGNIVTAVRLTGGTQSINLLAGQSFWDLRLAGTGTVTLNSDLAVANDLELEGTKTLSTGTNRAINLGGDFLFDGGSLTANSSTVTFNGSANQTIDRLTGSGTPSFFNITINKSGGTFTNATNVNLTNIFTVGSNTTVDFDGPSGTDIFTLASTSSRTAIVAAILSPANPNIVTGSVTAQRYMDGEGQLYRYISAPVTNPQTVDLQGELPVTGSFTGTSFTAPTNCTGCAPCTGCTTNNQSMFRYNGALAGTIGQRYEDFPANANTEVMEPARGYTVFVREGSNPTTWDVRGTINRGLQTFTPLAFTGTGANDSYNLVGNPYPSPIDWFVDDGATTWSRTNIDPSIYSWDNSISNYATYNRITNTGTNGGSRYVAVGQAFWVRTTAGGASMTANEGAKASQQPTFFREKQPEDYMRMKLLASNGTSNETLIHFNIEGGSDNFDNSIDSYSFPDAALKFFTLSKDARPLAINVLGALDCTKEIAVSVGALQPGTYSIQYSEFESFTSPVHIQFIDRFTGNSFAVNAEKSIYEFRVTTDSASFGSNRFSVIFSNKAINLGIQATAKNTCVGNEGQISLATSQTDVTYFASMGGEKVSEDMQGNGGALSINIPGTFLSEGENQVVLMAKYGSCDAVPTQNLKVNVGSISTITQVIHGVSCQPSKITLSASGAQEGGSYRWYESPRGGDPIDQATDATFVTPELQNSKSYYVSVLNSSGCESDRVEVKAEINALEPAEISVEGNMLRSNHSVGNRWLKDGEVISEEMSVMTSTPAVYTLEVRSGECLTVTSYEHDLSGIQIFPNPANEIITINVESPNEVEVDVYNTMGVRQGTVILKSAGSNRRTGTFDLRAGASGMYLIQIKDGSKFHQKKILKK